jgi:hypothetical protein
VAWEERRDRDFLAKDDDMMKRSGNVGMNGMGAAGLAAVAMGIAGLGLGLGLGLGMGGCESAPAQTDEVVADGGAEVMDDGATLDSAPSEGEAVATDVEAAPTEGAVVAAQDGTQDAAVGATTEVVEPAVVETVGEAGSAPTEVTTELTNERPADFSNPDVIVLDAKVDGNGASGAAATAPVEMTEVPALAPSAIEVPAPVVTESAKSEPEKVAPASDVPAVVEPKTTEAVTADVAAPTAAPVTATVEVVPDLRPAQLEELIGLMVGSFSSEAQSKEDKDYFDIRLEMREIWSDRAAAVTSGKAGEGAKEVIPARWLYVEQAMAARLDKPYRQRVYRVRVLEDGSFESAVFTLPGDALTFAGAWKDPAKLAGVTPGQLTMKDGCAVILRRQVAEGAAAGGVSYVGGTVGTQCASDLRGAKYASSTVTIGSSGMVSWDQGYDAQGTQVWGAVKGGYRFDRVGAK